MTFTIEDIKRLIPEARRLLELNSGIVQFDLGTERLYSHWPTVQALLTTRRQLEILQETLRQVDAIALSNPAGYYEPGEYDRDDEAPEDMTAFNASEIHTIIMEALEAVKEIGDNVHD